MKKVFSAIAVLLLLSTVCAYILYSSEITFSDVTKDDWFYDDVIYCYENGYVKGTSASKFSALQTATRAQVVEILYNIETKESGAYTPEHSSVCAVFDDVKSTDWYAKSVLWAYENNITSGVSARKFAPNTEVTREQLVCLIANYLDKKSLYLKPEDEGFCEKFKDCEDISSWADEELNWAVKYKIIFGSSNKVKPQGVATRAELSAIIKRFKTLPTIADGARLSNAFSDSMIMQRDKEFTVWGFADDSENSKTVVVSFRGESAFSKIEDGEWSATFDNTFDYSTDGSDIALTTKEKTTIIENVLVGDVYYVIGQSNVHYCLDELVADNKANGNTVEVDFDNTKNIRFFRNSSVYNTSLTSEYVQGTDEEVKDIIPNNNIFVDITMPKWETVADIKAAYDKYYPDDYHDFSTRTIASCNVYSALGYMFAYDLSEKTDVPIGIIEIDASGCPLNTFAPNELCEKWGNEEYDSETNTYYYSIKNAQGVEFANNTALKSRFAYNQLLYPVKNFSCAGLVWYQGESDMLSTKTIFGADYYSFSDQFTELMEYYRANIGDGSEFPVFIMEFPACYQNDALHLAYLDTGKVRCEVGIIPNMLSNSYAITSTGLFENFTWPNNIHPYIKHEQAKRLLDTVLAANDIYGISYDINKYAAPQFDSADYEDNSVSIKYRYVSDTLTYFDEIEEGVKGFEILTADGWISTYDTDNGEYADGCTVEITAKDTVTITYNKTILGVAYNQKTEYFYHGDVTLANSEDLPALAFVDFKK